MRGVLVSLGKAPSSAAVVNAILTAYDRAEQFAPSLRADCIAALRHHAGFLQADSTQLAPADRAVVDRGGRLLTPIK